MAPSFTIDNTPDFDMPTAASASPAQRTLLLAPPSVAAHPATLSRVAAAYHRDTTDIQMLDRLALGLVSLPPATYDVVLLLTDVDTTPRAGARALLDRSAMALVVASMKAGGRLRAQEGALAHAEQTEAILAGLVGAGDGQGVVKPDSSAAGAQTVTLSFGKKKRADAAAVPANGVEAAHVGKRKSEDISTGNGSRNAVLKATPAGVGFIDTTADFADAYEDEDEDVDMDFPDDDELARAGQIDPDTLLTEADRQKPLIIPDACKPTSKRRRACKDCSCGLAQRLAAEDLAKRSQADASLAQIKLSAEDLDEVDFTVQGKVGSCGNCALGDAFRCDGCPYVGLPAFRPGEEVRLLSNEAQL
ncbi:hypothetical protein LTR08_003020 [Meristemomyces frigidus]|nr:hypothetical protein LTR08_003020 [Meristemomyces frigidus]